MSGRSPSGPGHSAEPEPISVVSAETASVPNAAWRVGPIITKHPSGASYVLAGWVRGLFGLDYRYDPDGDGAWALTHLPTGYAAFAIQEPLAVAQSVADEVAGWGDWNFVDPSESVRFKGRLPELRSRYPKSIVHIEQFPLRTFMGASAIEARSDAAPQSDAAEGESAVGEAETPNPPLAKAQGHD